MICLISENGLKLKCTPKFLMWLCEIAEEFSFELIHDKHLYVKRSPSYGEHYDFIFIWHSFPLLIYRSVEGLNKIKDDSGDILTDLYSIYKKYDFKNYLSDNLTRRECALLHYLLDVYNTVSTRRANANP